MGKLTFLVPTKGVTLLHLLLLKTTSAVDITGYVGNKRHEYGIFAKQMNWFESMAKCNEDGYQSLAILPRTNSDMNLIKHVLRDNSYSLNSTFWTGLFRPYSYVTNWYDSTTSPCQTYPKDTVDGDVICSHQCVTLTFQDFFDEITLRAEACNISYPYICYNSVGPIKYDNYYNYSFTSVAPYSNVNVLSDVNVSTCQEMCTESGQCVGYSHNKTVGTCSILYLDTGYGYMTYTVEPAEFITHAYKTRLAPTNYASTATTPPEVKQTLPSCNVSDIPPGYCLCNISIQINNKTGNDVEELIQNMTINKEDTSKTRRRLTSAEDTRTSAKAMGVAGLTIMIAFVAVMFVFDFSLLVQHTMMGINLLRNMVNQRNLKRGKQE